MKIGAIADPLSGLNRSEIHNQIRKLEQAGPESLWTGILGGESFTQAGYLAALATEPKIAVGIINPYTRHPLIIARAATTLDRMTDHRTTLVLGFGWPPWIKHRFAIPQDPLKDMRTFVNSLRDLFAGKEVTCETKAFRLNQGSLRGPLPGRIPIYIAAEREKTLRLTGRIADGVFLGLYLAPGYVEWARDRLRREEAGPTNFEICTHIELCVTKEPAKAREKFKPDLAYFLAIPEGESFLQKAGFDTKVLPKIREAMKMPELLAQGLDPLLSFKVGNLTEAMRLIPEEYIDASCIVGDLAHCIERLAEYEKAGLTQAILSFQVGFESTVELLPKIIEEWNF